MAKNKNQPNQPNQSEPQTPKRGDQSDEASRKGSSGSERGSSESGKSGADRGVDRTRKEPGRTEEPPRKGKSREATETEGLDVDELDEQNQEL